MLEEGTEKDVSGSSEHTNGGWEKKEEEINMERDEGSFLEPMVWQAFLTSAYVSKTAEVETTSSIVDIFRQISEKFPLRSLAEQITAILAGARIRNVAGDALLSGLMSIYQSIYASISKSPLLEEKDKKTLFHAALLAFGGIATTRRTISTKDAKDYFTQIWKAINPSQHTYAAVLLTMGRLLDMDHKDIVQVEELTSILSNFTAQAGRILPEGTDLNGKKAFGAGIVVATLADISKDIETTKGLLQSYKSIIEEMPELTTTDLTAYILMCGHIRDFDIKHMFMAQSIETLVEKIKNKLVGA